MLSYWGDDRLTELLYYANPYLKSTKARVIQSTARELLLDKTVFFPQTSTEPGDLGKIGNFKISGLRKDEGSVWHILEKTHNFNIGDEVELNLNWDRRFKAMRLHSALHLLGSVFDYSLHERAVAGVVKPESAYLVFKKDMPEDMINQALEEARKVIQSNVEIRTYWDEKRKGFRWCKVGNYPPIPCGGLHVKNSGEIGNIRLLGKEMKGGKCKLSIGL